MDPELDQWMFVSDLCRSLWVRFTRDVDYDGIDVREYRLPDDAVDMYNPINLCFCPEAKYINATGEPDSCFDRYDNGTDQWDGTRCTKCFSGTIRTAGCLGIPIPIVMSLPHLLYAPPEAREMITGLEPVPNLHDTILWVEPKTGVAAKANKRMEVT